MGFEPTISAGERPQTYALHRAANGTGDQVPYPYKTADESGRTRDRLKVTEKIWLSTLILERFNDLFFLCIAYLKPNGTMLVNELEST